MLSLLQPIPNKTNSLGNLLFAQLQPYGTQNQGVLTQFRHSRSGRFGFGRWRDLRMERYIYYGLIGASVLALLGNLGVMLNNSLLSTMGFPGGAIVFALGLIAFGIATWRARVLPRYVALALMLWEPGSIATGLLLAPIS